MNRLDEAVADHTRTIELDPKVALYWANRSAAYLKLGRPDKAVEDASTAIELDEKFAAAWFNRGVANRLVGELEQAVADHRMVVRLGAVADIPQADGELAQSLNELAWHLTVRSEPKAGAAQRAVELAGEAVELAPAAGGYWNTLGVARYRARDWKAAVAALDRSMTLRRGGDAFDWFVVAMAHWRLGSEEEALRWYDRAVRWADDHPSDDEDLCRLRAEARALLGGEEKKD